MSAQDDIKADAYAEFTRVTEGNLGDASDFFALTPDEQQQALWNYRHMNWAKSPNTWATLLTIAGILGTVAVDASGVEGAVAAFRAL